MSIERTRSYFVAFRIHKLVATYSSDEVALNLRNHPESLNVYVRISANSTLIRSEVARESTSGRPTSAPCAVSRVGPSIRRCLKVLERDRWQVSFQDVYVNLAYGFDHSFELEPR